MHCRRATGKISASIVLISLGVITAALVYQWNAVVAPSNSVSCQVVIDSVALSETVSVANARWEITLIVRNDVNEEVLVNNIYVNKELADEYGLEPGGSLSNRFVIGTSLPVEGVVFDSNERREISIWIGSELFSSGNQISLHILNPNTLEYTRYIVLK
jgi:hypothetical protein